VALLAFIDAVVVTFGLNGIWLVVQLFYLVQRFFVCWHLHCCTTTRLLRRYTAFLLCATTRVHSAPRCAPFTAPALPHLRRLHLPLRTDTVTCTHCCYLCTRTFLPLPCRVPGTTLCPSTYLPYITFTCCTRVPPRHCTYLVDDLCRTQHAGYNLRFSTCHDDANV